LTSPEFDVPDRAKRFLTYVVEEAIAGRGDRIKAYSVATEVFGRGSDFDAQVDPVVRIEAGRLRRALEHYYLTAGRDDEIVTTIPKGGYLPTFTNRRRSVSAPALWAVQPEHPENVKPEATPHPLPRFAMLAGAAVFGLTGVLAVALLLSSLAIRDLSSARVGTAVDAPTPDVPRILVQQFEDLTGTPESAIIAKGLTEEIIGRIAKFKELVVVAAQPASTGQSRDAERYVLQGSVRLENEKLRLTAKVVSGDAVVWANIYDDDLDVRTMLDVQKEIASQVATAIARPHGVIFQADSMREAHNAPDDWAAYACTLSYYTYRTDYDPRAGVAVRDCLEQSVAQYPDYATAWALLSLVYVDQLRFRRNLDPTGAPALDRAAFAARHAVEIDPENVRALHALMMVLFFKNDVEEALKVGQRAIAINPNDSELIGEYGIRLSTSGEWALGAELIAKALDRNPSRSALLEAALALCLYMQRDYQGASAWIRRADVQLNPIYHLVAAAIFGQVGDAAAAEKERIWLLENAPEIVANLRQEFAMRNMKPADRAHFVQGLRKAGFSHLTM
jgi:TolB-like protein